MVEFAELEPLEMVKRTSVYLAEEQQIYRQVYRSAIFSYPDLDVVGLSGDVSGEALVATASVLKPNVMVIGVKTLQAALVEYLERVREASSETAIVLISTYYDVSGIKALREFSLGASSGCAYLLKHTIDTVDQLNEVIQAAAQGWIMMDPPVLEALMDAGDVRSTFIKELSSRELEVLSWMAKGYEDGTVANILGLKPKTMERYITNIYKKLGAPTESRHPRVHAVTLYLRTVGMLPVAGVIGALDG